MRERILAVFGALLLVGLAIFARGQLGSGDGGGGGKEGGGDQQSSELPVVACTPDLTSICAALAEDDRIAKDTPSLDLDKAGDPVAIKGIDGWITWSPAPEIAKIDADDVDLWGTETVLASAELGVLIDPSFGLDCGSPIPWSCLAKAAGQEVPVGVGRVTTAEGLARLAPLAPFLAEDDDATNVIVDRGRDILDGPVAGQDDAASMARRITTPGTLAAVIAPVDAAERTSETPQGRNRKLKSLRGEPMQGAAVVIVSRGKNLTDVVDGRDSGVLVSLGLSPGGSAPAIDAGALWQLRDQLK